MSRFIKNKRVLLLIITMQESFSAIIPYFLLSAFATMLYFTIRHFQIDFWFVNEQNFGALTRILNQFSSLLANIVIAYFLAIRIKISQIIAAVLSVATFVTVVLIQNHGNITLPEGFTPLTLINPIVSTLFLKLFYPRLTLNLSLDDGNRHIYRLFNYIFVFFFAYFATVLLFTVLNHLARLLIVAINEVKPDLPGIVILAIRDFLIQLSWFFGVHGEHLINGVLGKEILTETLFPHLSYAEFQRLFVNIGGAGIGFALFLALWARAKDQGTRAIVKVSTPFVFFNINTLLTYAFVAFNRFLFLPFLFLPLLNLLVAYTFLSWIQADFTDYYIAWTTPLGIDTYLKSDGGAAVMLLQVALLALDTRIYLHFVTKYLDSQETRSHFHTLERNLEVLTEIRANEGIHSFAAQKEIIDANAKLDEVVNALNKNNLSVFYQPKVDVKKRECSGYEALIRYFDGTRLTGPVFLDVLERAGLAPIIDIWVCKQVKSDLRKWREERFEPPVNVNLHPDTLKSPSAIAEVIQILRNEKITFEIIERSFLSGDVAAANLEKLRSNGFSISIDDFGVGYSSMEIITKFDIDELKIDKTLIDILDTEKGEIVCRNIVRICHEIGCSVVAEGVETRKQLEKLEKMRVDQVQGYYFSEALPFERVRGYIPAEREEPAGKAAFSVARNL